MKRSAPPAMTEELMTCRWRTGDRRCRIRVYLASHCAFHSHWLRLVDYGVLGRQQYDECCDWWEQFQPYGRYGNNPGIWWASMEVLWPALTGLGDAPVTTEAISRELLLRRAEVRKFLAGEAWERDPWTRMSGLPLPAWKAEVWQPKARAWAAMRDQEISSRSAKGTA